MAETERGAEAVLTTERLVVRHWTTADQARAFGFADGLTEIRAVLNPDNTRSAAVCRRLGMTGTGLTDRWYGRRLAEYRIGRDEVEAQ
ncbi:hypothetical protein [Streptomyces sp. CBMA156]|uniref:hypothetical protein n=1 Tax=Streptomyces sp. CBMA156 TaxID=1930280 RepID=UPI0016621AE2|nr:hypothetical protein [Streptomyces sp. CBMA156]MBD0674296.1 hypothetical protein [Streptomyces sp. CBMA156]